MPVPAIDNRSEVIAMPAFPVKRRSIAAGAYLLLVLLTPVFAAAAVRHDVLVDMFVWWNAAYKQKDGFTEVAFSKYFTDDAILRVNGSDRSKGLKDLAAHFRAIQARSESVEIELPFIDEFASANGDRIFTHHFVKAREKGQDSRERVMGYAAIRDGKISLINFVSVPDPVAK
jgi:ketosteroid isomerase-like protein